LLGIGKLKDIFSAVEQGVDLFDCVVPTREGRHGVLYTKEGKLNLQRGIFTKDKKIIEKGCSCFACKNLKIKRSELRTFFKSCDIKNKLQAQRLATIHNIYFYQKLFREIREAIKKGKNLGSVKGEYKI